MTIGDKIKALRVSAGMTQGELAEKVGTIKQTIYKYESGKVENIPLKKVRPESRTPRASVQQALISAESPAISTVAGLLLCSVLFHNDTE